MITVLGIQCVLLLTQLLCYSGTQRIIRRPRTVGLGRLDVRIPLVPSFVFVYLLWFPMLLGMPFLLYAYAPDACARYAVAMLVMLLICGVVFLCRPTRMARPAPPLTSAAGRLLALVYRIDGKALNCLPSIHCAASLCFLMGGLFCTGMPVPLQAAIAVLSLLICCSTVLVKQHAVADFLWAIPVTGAAWAVALAVDADKLISLLGL